MIRLLPLLLLLLLICGCSVNEAVSTGGENPPENITEPKNLTTVTPTKAVPSRNYYLMLDGIYRLDKNTGSRIKIRERDDLLNIVITDEWIYFCDDSRLYRMDNKNQRVLLVEETCSWLNMNDNWIFFGNESGIFKIRFDGSEREQIVQGDCRGMVLSGNFIFYIAYVSVNDSEWNEDGPPLVIGELHRADLDGKNDINLMVLVTNLCIYDNTIYFSDAEDNYFYCMNPETTAKVIFYKGHFIETPCFSGGYAYFVTDRLLHRMALSDGALEQFPEISWPHCEGVLDGYVYITTYLDTFLGPGLYRMEVDGSEFEKVDEIKFVD